MCLCCIFPLMFQQFRQILVCFFITVSCYKTSLAQNVVLKYRLQDSTSQALRLIESFQQQFSSEQTAKIYLQQQVAGLQAKGYITANVDSIFFHNKELIAEIYIGNNYTWKQLSFSTDAALILQQAGINTWQWQNEKKVNADVFFLHKQLVNFLENNGYPFARVWYDSISIEKSTFSATIMVDKGLLFGIDSLIVNGNLSINKQFLQRYLSLPPKQPFNAEKLASIDQKLNLLPYLTTAQPTSVQFLSNSYIVNSFLTPKKANQVNVLVGLLPANNQTGGKLLLTGQANLLLYNSFGNGERFLFNWQQLQQQSPRLQLQFNRPYLVNSQAGLDVQFELYKRDSFFVNVQSLIGVQYEFQPNHWLKIAYDGFSTRLINVDTNIIKQTQQLPDKLDLTNRGFRFTYFHSTINNQFNPIQGWEWKVSASFTQKNIIKNNTIEALANNNSNLANLYSFPLKTSQQSIRVGIEKYTKIGKQAVMKTAFQGAHLQAARLFTNELFQIGGIKLLRGFDEEGILAGSFGVATTEYRYLIGENSYFQAFSDVSFVQNPVQKTQKWYWGLGGGIALQTKQGILNVAMAIGKEGTNAFNTRQVKLHIAFVSFF